MAYKTKRRTIGSLELMVSLHQGRADTWQARADRVEAEMEKLQRRLEELKSKKHLHSERAAGYRGIISYMQAQGHKVAIVKNGYYEFPEGK